MQFSNLLIKQRKDNNNFSKKIKNTSHRQFISNYGLIKKYGFWNDSDNDGFINGLDCFPFDKKRQDQVIQRQVMPESQFSQRIQTPIELTKTPESYLKETQNKEKESLQGRIKQIDEEVLKRQKRADELYKLINESRGNEGWAYANEFRNQQDIISSLNSEKGVILNNMSKIEQGYSAEDIRRYAGDVGYSEYGRLQEAEKIYQERRKQEQEPVYKSSIERITQTRIKLQTKQDYARIIQKDYNQQIKSAYESQLSKSNIQSKFFWSDTFKQGTYYPKTDTININPIYPFKGSTKAHEIGHKLDFNENVIRDYSKYKESGNNKLIPDFLENLGVKKGNLNYEYYARSFENYIKNPEKFKSKYPEVAKEFEGKLGVESSSIYNIPKVNLPNQIGTKSGIMSEVPSLNVYEIDIRTGKPYGEVRPTKIELTRSEQLRIKSQESRSKGDFMSSQLYSGGSFAIAFGTSALNWGVGLVKLPYEILSKPGETIESQIKPIINYRETGSKIGESLRLRPEETLGTTAGFILAPKVYGGLIGGVTGGIKGVKESGKISEALNEASITSEIKKGYIKEKSLDAYKLTNEQKLELKRLKEQGYAVKEVNIGIKPKVGFEDYTPKVSGKVLEAIDQRGNIATRVSVGRIEATLKGKKVNQDVLSSSILKLGEEGNIVGYTELVQRTQKKPVIGIEGGNVYPKSKATVSSFYEESRITGLMEKEKVRTIKSETESSLISKERYTGKPLMERYKVEGENIFNKEGTLFSRGEFIEKQKTKKTKGLKIGKEETNRISPIEYAERLSKEGKIVFEQVDKERLNELKQLGLSQDIQAGQIKGKFSNEPDLNVIFVRKDLPEIMKQKKVAHELIHYKTEGLFDASIEKNLPYEKRPSEIIAIKNEQRFAEQGFKVKTGNEIGLLYGEKIYESKGKGYSKRAIEEPIIKERPMKSWNLFKEEPKVKTKYEQPTILKEQKQVQDLIEPSYVRGGEVGVQKQGKFTGQSFKIPSSGNVIGSSFASELAPEFSRGLISEGISKGVGKGLGFEGYGFKLNVGSSEVSTTQIERTRPRVSTASGLLFANKDLDITKTREKDLTKYGNADKNNVSNLFNTSSLEKTGLREKQREEQVQVSKQKLDFSRPSQRTSTGFFFFPEEFNPLTPITPTEEKKKKKRLPKKFITEVRRKGKFAPVSEASSFSSALGFGIEKVKSTLGASFRIREADTGKVVSTKFMSREFKPSKKEAGVMIQQRGFRLGSIFERREISRAKRKSIGL